MLGLSWSGSHGVGVQTSTLQNSPQPPPPQEKSSAQISSQLKAQTTELLFLPETGTDLPTQPGPSCPCTHT